MIAYIHGFNSSPASNTFCLLQGVFPHARALNYPSSGIFSENIARLHGQAWALLKEGPGPLVLVGSSLGGFYAAQLSASLDCNCALFNPVVWPAQALRQFVGPNTCFHSGQRWEFTNAMCDSYALFPNARNASVERLVVLGRADTLLDPAEARSYWKNHARIHETDDGHNLAALDATIIDTLSVWQQ